jgi:hypothetical protein
MEIFRFEIIEFMPDLEHFQKLGRICERGVGRGVSAVPGDREEAGTTGSSFRRQ